MERSATVADYVKRIRARLGSRELLQVPSVSVALRDRSGRVLLARHSEHGQWLLPGGAIEPGEVPADAAVREMWEETGLVVCLTRLVGVFGGRDFIVRYRNGDETSYAMVVFEAQADSGSQRPDRAEVLELKWCSQADLPELQLARWVPEVLTAVFQETVSSQFRQSSWQPGKER